MVCPSAPYPQCVQVKLTDNLTTRSAMTPVGWGLIVRFAGSVKRAQYVDIAMDEHMLCAIAWPHERPMT